MDLDEDTILDKVAKASGELLSLSKESGIITMTLIVNPLRMRRGYGSLFVCVCYQNNVPMEHKQCFLGF